MSLFDLIKDNKTDDVVTLILFGDTSDEDLMEAIRMTEDFSIIWMVANDINFVKKIPEDVLRKIYSIHSRRIN